MTDKSNIADAVSRGRRTLLPGLAMSPLLSIAPNSVDLGPPMPNAKNDGGVGE